MRSLHKVFKPEQIVTNSVKIGIYRESDIEAAQGEEIDGSTSVEEEIVAYGILISEEKRRLLEHAREQARQSASKILEDAYDQRDKIVNSSSEEAARIRKQAEKDGYEEGLRRALEEIKGCLSDVTAFVGDMEKRLAVYETETEHKLVDLALYMMEKVLKKSMEENETVLLDLAEKAILSERDKSNIVVHLSDATMELINALEVKLGPLMANGGHFGNIKLRADNVAPGTVQIETEEGIVDASVDVQIENLKRQLSVLNGQA